MLKKPRIREFQLLLAPPLFWLILFFCIPLLLVMAYSFSPQDVYGGVKHGFTLEHYQEASDVLYLSILWRSLRYAFTTTLLTALIAYPMAYYMAFASPKTKLLLMFLVILPFWTNFLIRMYSFIIILSGDGLLNTALLKIGLLKEPLMMLHNSFAVHIGFIYGNLPYMILPLFAALDKMDSSLLEASMDLGAGHLRTFWRITFPQSLAGLAAGIVFVFIPTLGNFVVPELLGSSEDYMLGNVINRQFLGARNWPFGAALSSMLTFALMIIIALYIRYFDPVRKQSSMPG